MVQMEYNGVKPTFQSYAACLECLGRQTLFASEVATRILADIKAAVSIVSRIQHRQSCGLYSISKAKFDIHISVKRKTKLYYFYN